MRDGIRRLFPDTQAECARHIKRRGYFPIMHLIAIKDEVAQSHPEIPFLLMRLWDEAKSIADDFYHDPGFSLSTMAEQQYQSQKNSWGADLWPSGLTSNRANLELFIEDMLDQGLIKERIPLETLFHESTLDT